MVKGPVNRLWILVASIWVFAYPLVPSSPPKKTLFLEGAEPYKAVELVANAGLLDLPSEYKGLDMLPAAVRGKKDMPGKAVILRLLEFKV
jgi:hypothetical protein